MSEAGKRGLRRRASELYVRLISLAGPPRGIGVGFAVGTVVALSPFWGLHTALIAVLCAALRVNVPAGVVATYVVSPVTAPYFYYFEYKLGRWLMGNPPHAVPWAELKAIRVAELFASRVALDAAWDLLEPFFFGWLPVAAPVAVASYFLVVRAVVRYRARRAAAIEADE